MFHVFNFNLFIVALKIGGFVETDVNQKQLRVRTS